MPQGSLPSIRGGPHGCWYWGMSTRTGWGGALHGYGRLIGWDRGLLSRTGGGLALSPGRPGGGSGCGRLGPHSACSVASSGSTGEKERGSCVGIAATGSFCNKRRAAACWAGGCHSASGTSYTIDSAPTHPRIWHPVSHPTMHIQMAGPPPAAAAAAPQVHHCDTGSSSPEIL